MASDPDGLAVAAAFRGREIAAVGKPPDHLRCAELERRSVLEDVPASPEPATKLPVPSGFDHHLAAVDAPARRVDRGLRIPSAAEHPHFPLEKTLRLHRLPHDTHR